MKRITALLLFLASLTWVYGQDFDQYFTDATLRIDYIFSGDVNKQNIAVLRDGMESDNDCRKYLWKATDRLSCATIIVSKLSTAILSPRSFRNGYPTTKPKLPPVRFRMYSLPQCPRTLLM